MNKKLIIIIIGISFLTAVILLSCRITTKDTPTAQPAVPNSADVVSKDTESALRALALSCEDKGNLLKAKEAYQKMVEMFPNSTKIDKTQEALDNINIRILFSPIATEDSFLYDVQKGDNLVKIAKKFGTTRDLIAISNNIRGDNIRYGKKLKVTKLKFSIVVDKSQNILTLKANDKVFKTYKVATGKNFSTPVGTFKITTRIVDPPWYPPTGGVVQSGDPKNVLGSRWLGISVQGYGIHGTIEPESIGKNVTEGCVRMRNPEVEELYTIVPEGTEVVIVD